MIYTFECDNCGETIETEHADFKHNRCQRCLEGELKLIGYHNC